MTWTPTGADWLSLSPLLVVSAAAAVILLVLAFYRSAWLTAALTVLALAAGLVLLGAAWSAGPRSVTDLLIIDGYSLFFMGLIFAAALVVAVLAYVYFNQAGATAGQDAAKTPALPQESEKNPEFYVLLLLATAGSAVLVASRHFASFFLALEILSVSLYALAAFNRPSRRGLEAGVKYLVLAATSAAFLLFGMALVYAHTGTMDFTQLARRLGLTGGDEHSIVLLAGLMLILVGVGFKLALVPFHLWTPDVYQGAPAPVTAFVATVSKGAMFALLLRFFVDVNFAAHPAVLVLLTAIAVASMFAGNLLALRQNNIKRMLAYSSIAQLGYLLVALLSAGPGGEELPARAAGAAGFFLAAYFITTLGAFGVVCLLSGPDEEAEGIGRYRGLALRRPALAGVLTAMLLSLAGIPLTAGFLGKFYILAAGVNSHLLALTAVLVINSGIGLYYYVRWTIALFMPPTAEPAALRPVPIAGGVVLGSLSILLLWIGVYPSPLIRLIETLVKL